MQKDNPHLDPEYRQKLEAMEKAQCNVGGMAFSTSEEDNFTSQLRRRVRVLNAELEDLHKALHSIEQNPELLKTAEDLGRINRLRGWFNGKLG